jgi:membrane-bound lytic murein transglycosylase D
MARRFPLPILLLAALILATAPHVAAQDNARLDDEQELASVPDTSRLQLIDNPISLGERDATLVIASIYGVLQQVIESGALGNEARVQSLLDSAVRDLDVLAQQDYLLDDSRYRELYRSVVTEYERFYGANETMTMAYGDIFSYRDAMFASLNTVDEPLLEDVTLPELPAMETSIPMTMNRLVQSSITFLQREPDKHLNHWLARAETYFPMIERILAEEGVPDELKYLAMVESGLNPRARSWARAVGMWQFIAATGKAYDLTVNGWIDERMDPEKATRAAARHLKDLHAMFDGDWQLALAGYNYSPSKVRRALRRAEASLGRRATFWDIYTDIPRETRNYVPMFIATALIVSNPERFDVQPVQPGPTFAFHRVPVYGMHTLADIARLSASDATIVKALNPELTRNSLPPSSGAYWVRIPVGTYDTFAENYKALPESVRQPTSEHTVLRGETLGELARRYGTTVDQVKSQNNLNSNTIRVGQRLAVPVIDYAGPLAEATDESGAELVHYGRRNLRPILAASPSELPIPVVNVSTRSSGPSASSSSEPSGTRVRYTVKPGDTLSEIGEKYGVSQSRIRGWNNLRSSRIRAGQTLTIYTDNANAAPVVYTVRQGDTLSRIASRHGVSIAQLRAWNDISGSRIYAGQRLTVQNGG